MNTLDPRSSSAESDDVPSREILDQAGEWISLLSSPDRSPEVERDLQAWLAASPEHRKAFERATNMWTWAGKVTLADAYATVNARAEAIAGAASRAAAAGARGGAGGYAAPGRGFRRALLVAVPTMAAIAFVFLRVSAQGDAYATRIGEQQTVVLDDGSRMTLNTNTRVRVKMRAERRSVEIEEGEALFEVAKDPHRPFVVRAGGSEVEAVGTVFSVRLADGGERLADKLAVTLVEGKVNVRADPSAWSQGLAPNGVVQMHAGERIQLDKMTSTNGQVQEKLDKPRMDRLLAWKHNEAVFDDVSLSDAIAEMNRYSRTPITLRGDATLAQLRVSGQFKTGDNVNFAQAVSALHGLTLKRDGSQLALSLPH